MKSPEVTIEICVALVSELLAGYRGYPATEAGVRRFAVAVQENCISVSHARATLKSFDELFPTVRQICDVAINLRPQFEPSEVDQHREWERQYGKPQPFDLYPKDEMALHWTAIRDAIYYGWPCMAKDEKEHPDTVAFIRRMIQKYGMSAVREMASPPEPMPYVNPSHRPRFRSRIAIPAVAAPLTQADLAQAMGARKSPAEVDRELDGWTDPDR